MKKNLTMPNPQQIAVDPSASEGTLQHPLPPDPAQQPGEEAGDGEAVAAPPLPPLKSVFDCPKLQRDVVQGGVVGWVCAWCGIFFKGVYATRALKHVLKVSLKSGVRACPAAIPVPFMNR